MRSIAIALSLTFVAGSVTAQGSPTLPSAACRSHPELWAECVVGATKADSYFTAFTEAGLVDLEELNRLDYFAGSSSAETRKVAGSFGAHSIVLRGRKG